MASNNQASGARHTLNKDLINSEPILDPTKTHAFSPRARLESRETQRHLDFLKKGFGSPQIITRALDKLPEEAHFEETVHEKYSLVTKWLVTFYGHRAVLALPVTWTLPLSTGSDTSTMGTTKDQDSLDNFNKWLTRKRPAPAVPGDLMHMKGWQDVAVFAHLAPHHKDPYVVYLKVYGPKKKEALVSFALLKGGTPVEIAVLPRGATQQGRNTLRMFGKVVSNTPSVQGDLRAEVDTFQDVPDQVWKDDEELLATVLFNI